MTVPVPAPRGADDLAVAHVALVVDRRGLPLEARGPAFLDALDVLPSGGVLVLVDDHEPRQLAELLVPLGFGVTCADRGDGTWRSRITAP